ncbi:Sodium/hydrogen exchanger family-domain-containing protein [Cladochytrium replicatum]|nr:Sodium/hydrogen exchanger family-domain-containing protein [Cladochytrium replicatum]
MGACEDDFTDSHGYLPPRLGVLTTANIRKAMRTCGAMMLKRYRQQIIAEWLLLLVLLCMSIVVSGLSVSPSPSPRPIAPPPNLPMHGVSTHSKSLRPLHPADEKSVESAKSGIDKWNTPADLYDDVYPADTAMHNFTEMIMKEKELFKTLRREKDMLLLELEKNATKIDVEQEADDDNGQTASELRIRELSELEMLVRGAVHIFMDALAHRDFQEKLNDFQHNVLNLKLVTQSERVREKEDELKIKKLNETQGDESIIAEISRSVAETADKLESQQHKQNDVINDAQKFSKDASFDTVLRVQDDVDVPKDDNSTKSEFSIFGFASIEKNVAVLIDTQGNQYVLSKANDITTHYEDSRLLRDIFTVLLTCFVCSFFMFLFNLPSFFGYILAGVLLGPTGTLQSVIQIETIARGLGIMFIMFFLGLEFNYSKIQKVWRIAFLGSLTLLVVSVTFFVFTGYFVGASPKESAVVGACVFLSSTVVVVKAIGPEQAERAYGRAIIGICLAQDIILGLMLAVLPVLEKSGTDVIHAIARLVLALTLFLIVSALLAHYPFRYLLNKVKLHGGRELYLLTVIGICLVLIELGGSMGLGIEISCFIAGVTISSQQWKSHAESTIHAIEPLKDVFAAMFFASIGLHIYPSFFLNEGVLLLLLAAAAVAFKYANTIVVMMGVFRYDMRTASLISTGLAQISEFTFVIASRAKSNGTISREAYYTLLGTASISLIISPLLWRISGASMEETLLPLKRSAGQTDDDDDADKLR